VLGLIESKCWVKDALKNGIFIINAWDGCEVEKKSAGLGFLLKREKRSKISHIRRVFRLPVGSLCLPLLNRHRERLNNISPTVAFLQLSATNGLNQPLPGTDHLLWSHAVASWDNSLSTQPFRHLFYTQKRNFLFDKLMLTRFSTHICRHFPTKVASIQASLPRSPLKTINPRLNSQSIMGLFTIRVIVSPA